MYNVIHYESLCEYIMYESGTRIIFRQRVTKVSPIYVSADVSLLFSATAKRTIVRKMWKLMRRRRTCSPSGNYRSMTQVNLEWHADYPARKVDHSNGDSDGSPVNRSDLQRDLLQLWCRFRHRHVALTIFVAGKYVYTATNIYIYTIVFLLTIITVRVVNWRT